LILKCLIAAGIFLLPLGGVQANDGVAPGMLEGHLKIASAKTVEVAEARSSKGAGVDYAEYPFVILNPESHKEIVSVTADKDGNYRVALPPGDYVLDAKGRAPGHVRAAPKRFTVVSNQTVHVDFELDTGIR
jgi:Carboxypeptidase regulatory-like domain